MKKFLFLLCSLLMTVGAWATTATTWKTVLVTSTDQFAEGKLYAFRVNGGSYITESEGQYVAPNAQNAITDEALFTIEVNPEGAYTVKNNTTGNYWADLTGSATGTFLPGTTPGYWTFTFNGNNVQAGSNGFFINRSSGVMHGWNTGINLQCYEVSQIEVTYIDALSELSNNKCYNVVNRRAAWNVADNATSANATTWNIDAVSERFALINYNGNYYIYSVNAKAFLTKENTLGEPDPVTIVESGVEGYPFFFKYDDSHNINISGGRMIIDGWTTVDEGNANTIIEAADFDPFEAIAKIDPTTAAGQNLDFSESTPLGVSIHTYAKDIVGENVAQLQPVEGWTMGENGDARAAGIFAYGSTNFVGGDGYIAPATNPEGNVEGNALGLVAVWSATAQYTQKVILGAGGHQLTIPVYNSKGGASVPVKSLIGFIANDGTEYLAPAKAYPVGEWTNEVITFTLDKETAGYLTLGYQGQNVGSANAQHLFFDGVKIEEVATTDALRNELLAALVEANATLEDKAGVGEGLFMIPTEAYDTFAAAVAAAQTVADNAEATAEELETAKTELAAAVATYAAAEVNAPEEGVSYTFQQKATGMYLALDAANDKVMISETAQAFTFEAGEGGYYLINEEGAVGFAGTNNWTMSANAEKKMIINPTPVDIDGVIYYTLDEVKGMIATDGETDGSACYTDKSVAKSGDKAYWTIAKVEAPKSEAYVALETEIATAEEQLAAAEKEDGKEEFQAAIEAAKAELGKTDEEMSAALETLKAAEVAFATAQEGGPTPEPVHFEYAKYIVKNVGSGLYWGAGNDWGTRASLIKSPEFVKIDPTDMPEGQYKLESQVNNGGTQYYFNGDYMDNGNPVGLIITKLANGNYTIALASDGTLYGYDGTSTVLGKELTNAEDPNAQWTIQSLDEAKAALANATEEAPMNASLLFDDLNFGRNNRYSSKWIVSADCTNKNLSGGNNVNNCAESFHSVFTVNQSVEAPNGLYAVTAQGFYRQDGTDNDNLPVFFANEETMTFPLKTGAENSMSDASASFTNGLYTIEPIYVQVTDGQLNIGTKLETNTSLWCIWDNFQVMYYGPDADVNNVKFAALIAQVDELRAKAEALKENADVTEPVKAVLETALAETAEVAAEEEALNAAIATLNAAIEPAEVCVDIAPKLAAAKRLVESTNVYTAEAKAAYEAVIAEAEAKYQEGTLTRAEASAFVNPEIVAGWHSSNAFDDMLLSAWTINEAQCADFTTALYINTWSVEGETDGSDFKVPFFEYWTGDDASLGTATLTATMNGLEAGLYEVSVWARVRAKNGYTAPTTGITLDVNGGEATDIAAGQQVGTSQFFLAEFKAVGSVAEDGVLKININVAADNNISWLSFKNVNYTAKDETEYAYEQALANLKDGYTYRIFVEKDEAKYYLKADGYLTASEEEAKVFTFNAVNVTGKVYPTSWNLGCRFTNPETGGQTTFENDGHIHVGSQDRDDWERQVFFLKDGKYAVRATNANNTAWGSNTYWDAFDGAELPEAGYSLEPAYIWQVETFVDLSGLDNIIAELEAIIAATDTYADEAGAAATATAALEAIKAGEYGNIEAVNAAIAQVRTIGNTFLTAIAIKKDIDATNFFLVNPTPTANYNGWEGSKSNAFDAGNNVAEFWNMSGANFHQTVTLPEGTYRLIVVALTRTDMASYVYAGENQTTIVGVGNPPVNSRAQANEWFNQGNGVNVVDFEMAEAGDIEIGLTADNTNGDHWTVWRSFRIILTGEPASTEATITYDGEALTFDENNNVQLDGAYDESLLSVVSEDENATVTTSYEEKDGSNVLTITVKGADADTNPNNVVTYTVTFDVAVGINAVDADLENAVIYDLAGRRVSKANKGIYIINGKKVAIK